HFFAKQSQFAGGQNDVNLVMARIYGGFDRWRWRKNKAKTKPIVSLRPEIRSTKHENRNNFAKQSQF
ncbi:MAG: hypothetical protein ACYTFW_21775, partial [Planctomycetota bacterium]